MKASDVSRPSQIVFGLGEPIGTYQYLCVGITTRKYGSVVSSTLPVQPSVIGVHGSWNGFNIRKCFGLAVRCCACSLDGALLVLPGSDVHGFQLGLVCAATCLQCPKAKAESKT
jgi:hypothetical protein